MVNHPNRNYRYYAVCPRGFANEITYIRVRPNEVSAVDSHFYGFGDCQFDLGNTGAWSGWTNERRARIPGVALSWADYQWMARVHQT